MERVGLTHKQRQKMFDHFLAHEGIKNFVFFSTAKAAAEGADEWRC